MTEPTSQSFGQIAAQALTAATASPELATRPSTSSADSDHRRHFVTTFRRWAILFKRKDANPEDDKWLIAEYYKSLGHLSEAGLDALTEVLKKTHVFFPTVKECLDATRCDRYDWGHPFLPLRSGRPSYLLRRGAWGPRLPAPVRELAYGGGHD